MSNINLSVGDNNLKQITYSNAAIATPNVPFTYDSNFNHLLTMTVVDGTGTNGYDYYNIAVPPTLGAGRLKSVVGPLTNSTVVYQYDALGRITNRAINGVAQIAAFDALGRVTTLTNALGTFTYNYVNATPRLSSIAYPNGQGSSFSYFGTNADLRLQTIWHTNSVGATISKFDYTYESDGQIPTWTQQADANTPSVWVTEYDPADQLLSVTVHSNSVAGAILKEFVYAYDSAGNRTKEQISVPGASSSLLSAAANSLNQVAETSVGGTMRFKGHLDEIGTVRVAGANAPVDRRTTNFTGFATVSAGTNAVQITATDYSGNSSTNSYQVAVTNNSAPAALVYDVNGNLVSNITAALTASYEWDGADRLTAFNVGTTRSELSYDGFGRRVRIIEKTNGVVTADHRFLWCGLTLCEEHDASSTTVTKRFFAQGEQISGTNYFFTRDHLGSVREMTDGSGTVRSRYDYDPYGNQTRLTGNLDADFAFTGHYRHAGSGLILAAFRAYSSESGRWLSRDPVEENAGPNVYSYVHNQPTTLTDPLGLDDCKEKAKDFIQDAWEAKHVTEKIWGKIEQYNGVVEIFHGADKVRAIRNAKIAKQDGAFDGDPSSQEGWDALTTAPYDPLSDWQNNYQAPLDVGGKIMVAAYTPVVKQTPLCNALKAYKNLKRLQQIKDLAIDAWGKISNLFGGDKAPPQPQKQPYIYMGPKQPGM